MDPPDQQLSVGRERRIERTVGQIPRQSRRAPHGSRDDQAAAGQDLHGVRLCGSIRTETRQDLALRPERRIEIAVRPVAREGERHTGTTGSLAPSRSVNTLARGAHGDDLAVFLDGSVERRGGVWERGVQDARVPEARIKAPVGVVASEANASPYPRAPITRIRPSF